MASIWVGSLGRNFEASLGGLATAVRDCPDELWEASMWPVVAPGPDVHFVGADWKRITDTAQRDALVQRWVERRSTPWSVAWHALEVCDYDLSAELGQWAPPPPFAGHPHWRDLPSLPAAWSRSDILGYIDHCRERARDTLANMTDEKAATPMPAAHRYVGQPYAWVLAAIPLHTTEHAAQIGQFITRASAAG